MKGSFTTSLFLFDQQSETVRSASGGSCKLSHSIWGATWGDSDEWNGISGHGWLGSGIESKGKGFDLGRMKL